MTDSPLSRRLFIAKAAALTASSDEPHQHMQAIVRHFAAMAPDGAGRLMIQIGGTPEAVGYVAHAYVSSWVPDARLRGGGLYVDEAIELARVCGLDARTGS